jgi:hypothetical protein
MNMIPSRHDDMLTFDSLNSQSLLENAEIEINSSESGAPELLTTRQRASRGGC